MDEGVKQVIVVAIAVVCGIALIALIKSDGAIMNAIGSSLGNLVNKVTNAVN